LSSTRAKKPAGFSLWECWGDALDLDPESPPGQAARYMYKEVFDGVRLMMKFKWFMNGGEQLAKMMHRIERARYYGLKIHLVADWFDESTGPNTYHAKMWKPDHKTMQKEVEKMCRVFKPAILEVCNEPYHIHGKRVGHYPEGEYVKDVSAFVRGARKAKFQGKILASGTRKEVGWKITKGWEWHAERWEKGMLEGKHSLVLHEAMDEEDIIEGLTGKFYEGKAIGYQWPIYESEFSPVARHTHIDTHHGAKLAVAGVKAAMEKQFPLCFLTMGGYNDDFGRSKADGGWGMHTDLINNRGELSKAARAIAEEMGAPEFVLQDDTDPPPPPPDDDTDPIDPPDDGGGTDGGSDDSVGGRDPWLDRADRAMDLIERLLTFAEENPELLALLLKVVPFEALWSRWQNEKDPPG
jgi:hypothetical protein